MDCIGKGLACIEVEGFRLECVNMGPSLMEEFNSLQRNRDMDQGEWVSWEDMDPGEWNYHSTTYRTCVKIRQIEVSSRGKKNSRSMYRPG